MNSKHSLFETDVHHHHHHQQHNANIEHINIDVDHLIHVNSNVKHNNCHYQKLPSVSSNASTISSNVNDGEQQLSPIGNNFNSPIQTIGAHFDEFEIKSTLDKDFSNRKQIKSFIDFDVEDEVEDGDDNVFGSCRTSNSKRLNRRVVKSTSEYGQELINVFNVGGGGGSVDGNDDESNNNKTNTIDSSITATHSTNLFKSFSVDAPMSNCKSENPNSSISKDDVDDDDDEEWNQFQGSEMATNMDYVFDDLNNKQSETQMCNGVSACNLNDDDDVDTNDDLIMDNDSDILYDRLQQMEQEQDVLNNSLLALTSHFAQVQLRLRQIVEAKDVSVDKREVLLRELENFANRGIPELMMATSSNPLERSVSMATSLMADDVFEEDNDECDDQVYGHSKFESEQNIDCHSVYSKGNSRHNSCSTTVIVTEDKLERQRNRQKELICQLKEQLEDLERYAYETGELNSLPSSMLLERQNAIIEQLKSKLPVLSIEEIDKLSPEELRLKVDHAVKEVLSH